MKTAILPNPSPVSAANHPEAKDSAEWKATVKRNTSLHLASDLIARGLQESFDSLRIYLIQISDSGLLESESLLVTGIEKYIEDSESLESSLTKSFPQSRCFGANFLLRRDGGTLLGEVALYRQEAFWLAKNEDEYASEQLVVRLFGFYKNIEALMHMIESCIPDEYEPHEGAPKFVPNSYCKTGN